MKYLKLFENHAGYEAYKNSQNYLTPNVSYCVDLSEVHYNKYVRRDYSKEYLTIEAIENGTISFNIWKSMGTEYITSISYSTDNGETWTTTNNTDNKSEHLTITVNVNEGDKVLWKGDAQQMGYYDTEDIEDSVGSFFSSTAEFNVYGNIMSLLYGDNFYGKTVLEYNSQFSYLFSNFDGETVCNVVNAANLSLPANTLAINCYSSMFGGCTSLTTAPELPATTLVEGCYINMFYGCTSLTTAPELPATTLAEYCYSNMFGGCTSLTTAPELPATTLAEYCYNQMFNGCTSLTTAPELPATTLVDNCYFYMFNGCTSLTTAPELPATTLVGRCYSNMFNGCTSLTTAPELPATTLADYCYFNMFNGCTSLTAAPELPATTLVEGCYSNMFNGCTSLTAAPELPATTLVNYCYNNMFQGCSNLNYIKAMFTTTPSPSYTNYWVSGVSSTGTFVKNRTATWTTTGVHGVPSGWTVETAIE